MNKHIIKEIPISVDTLSGGDKGELEIDTLVSKKQNLQYGSGWILQGIGKK